MTSFETLGGDTASGWETVADAFRANFEQLGELGAACAVYVDGSKVVDVWGGTADERTGRPWQEDTVATVFSTTKGAAAICAHMLVERGQLELNAPVVKYWPEYGAHGKDRTLVRWCLAHQAGVPAVDAKLSLEDLCAWDPVLRALEDQTPFWTPGEHHLYHALTYGFLVGELVRRVTGTTLGAFFAEQVAEPLRLDAWIGLPADVEPRVAHLVMDTPPADIEAAVRRLFERSGLSGDAAVEGMVSAVRATRDRRSLSARSLNLGGALPDGLVTEEGGHNARSARAAEMPGSNMVTDARSVARMYAATVGDVDGVRLLRPDTVDAMSVVQTTKSTPFVQTPGLEALDTPISLGFMRPSPFIPLLGQRSFGHPGAGGSIGFADPDARVGFAYVMNRMSSGVDDYARALRLIEAVAASLGP